MRRLNSAVVCVMSCLTCASQAGTVYQYMDDRGVVTFTDQYAEAKPYNPIEVDVWEPEQDAVSLRYTDRGNLYLYNSLYGPVTVTLQPSKDHDVIAHRDLLQPIVVPPRTEIFVDQVHYMGNDGQLTFSYHFSVGTPNTDIQEDRGLIQVPFVGRFLISQAFNGKYSHHLPGNRYAIDIAMPEGTPILAARSGKVLDMRDNYSGHSNDPAERARTNYIRLLHDDGTMTLYAHVATNSIQVKPGQRVSAGTLIATSGNTGYSTGPHLHFAVQVNNGKRVVSIPFQINGQTPIAGMVLMGKSKNR